MNFRLTETNAADDSGGSVWGLDGNLFMPVVASAAISIGVLLLLFALFHVHWLVSALIGAVPFELASGEVVAVPPADPQLLHRACSSQYAVNLLRGVACHVKRRLAIL